jgi:hypothetical protein
MTESVMAVTEWALSSPSVTRVRATCDVENLASVRVLEKAGLVNRGGFEREIVRPNLSAVLEPVAGIVTGGSGAAEDQRVDRRTWSVRGLSTAVAKVAIATLSTRRSPNRWFCRAIWAMMQGAIRSGP